MLTEQDLNTLRTIAGDVPEGFAYGACASVCATYLKNKGLVNGHYFVSDLGVEFLEWSESRGWSLNLEKFHEDRNA